MNVATQLDKARLHAAHLSGGTSSEPIYYAILGAVNDLDLHGSVLDFGAGTGSLTQRLIQSRRFSSITAADLMPQPSDLQANWIRADLNNPLPVPAVSFDSIITAEVIEHLENPRSVAREWFRLLKPGGIVIISTPNNESLRSLLSLLFRGHHVAFCDASYPAHITALVRKDLERILTEAGFDRPIFRFTNYGGIPAGPTITWQQISSGLFSGLRFSDNLVAIAQKPINTGAS